MHVLILFVVVVVVVTVIIYKTTQAIVASVFGLCEKIQFH